jgi:transcriptional regulator with XRE-family HTH domain
MNIPLMVEQRKGLGLTQEDIAEEFGIDRSSVAAWETGKAVPDVRRIPKLAALLGLTADELLADPKTQVEAVAG